jgi:hypothetical protein
VKYDLSERVFNPAVYEGHDGIRRFVADLDEVWDEFRIEPVEFIDAGETVVVSHRVHARGKGSGVEVELPSTSLYTLRNRDFGAPIGELLSDSDRKSPITRERGRTVRERFVRPRD